MRACVLLLGLLPGVALAQGVPPAVEVANLREDVRLLSQRVGDLGLRLEQLERENAELRRKAGGADKAFVTPRQLDQAVADSAQTLRAAIAASKAETLQQVSGQMEKLGRQTNAALDALAKGPSARPAAFGDDFPKEGVSYTVQKGDTLTTIARKTGGKPQDIINANKISDPARITVGQTLFIPGGK